MNKIANIDAPLRTKTYVVKKKNGATRFAWFLPFTAVLHQGLALVTVSLPKVCSVLGPVLTKGIHFPPVVGFHFVEVGACVTS